MSEVQIAIIDQEDTQITLAVPGVQGPVGNAIPAGGTTNQVLFKSSATNYDATWGNVTSAMITDLAIVNADVNASAAIAGSKISPDFGAQTIVTTGVISPALGTAALPSVAFTGDLNTGIFSPGADQLAISTNGTGRLFIGATGNVGVATASPNVALEVNGVIRSGTGSGATLATGSIDVGKDIGLTDGQGIVLGTARRISISSTGTTTLNAAAATAPFIANIGASEVVRINSSARLLVGTPTDLNVTGRINILYTSNVEAGISIQSSVDSYNTAISFLNTSGTQVGYISTAASSTAYSTSSDYRLKENVTPVPDGITRLQQLKPSRFNFIADPDYTVDGFLAHEVQDIVPEAITGEKDAVDADGKPVYQGIDQSKLVPLLTAALQEAIAKIESLDARLTAAGID